MAQFIDPFVGNNPGKELNVRELIRAIRQSIAAEHEAVHFYEAIADSSGDERVKRVMQDIADEEKVHVHEFQVLLDILDKSELESKVKGTDEAKKLLEEKKEEPKPEETKPEKAAEAPPIPKQKNSLHELFGKG